MLSREYLREHADAYRSALKNRGASVDLDRFIELEADRRRVIAEVEGLKAKRNAASMEIANLKKNKQDASAQIEATKGLGDEIKSLDEKLAAIEGDLRNVELYFPNVPHESVPIGPDETHNRVERTWGERPSFNFTPKSHWDIGEALGILDFDRATKITGARFSILSGAGAKLNRALMNFMLDVHEQQGYTEVVPPFIVNADSLLGTGQLPKFEEDLFKLTDRDYYLIPTAEVPVTNLHRSETLDAAQLPLLIHRLLAMFPQRGGVVWQRHARTDSSASIRESRDREVHDAGDIVGRARDVDRRCRSRAAGARSALSRDDALHRRYGIHRRENV